MRLRTLLAVAAILVGWSSQADAQFLLKKSTAFNRPFVMIDSTDHVSGKTGLTITCKISKDGADTGAPGGSITQVGSSNMPGHYYIAYSTTDTGTAGSLTAYCTATGADPTSFTDLVVDPAAAFLGMDVIKFGGTTVTGRDLGASVLLSAGTGTGQVNLSSGNVPIQTGTGTGQLDFTSGVVKATAGAANKAPIFNVAKSQSFTRTFPLTDSTDHFSGKTGASPTCKISKNGGSGATTTNSATEVDSTNHPGLYKITITASEADTAGPLDIDCTATGSDRVKIPGFVVELGVRHAVAQAGASTSITLDSGASATTDFYKGMSVAVIGGTGTGQAGRFITAYNGSTKVATVTPAWATNPSSDSVFVLVPANTNVEAAGGAAGTFASGRPEVNTSHIAGAAVSTSTAQIGANVVNFGGSAGTFASGRPEVNTSHFGGSAGTFASGRPEVNSTHFGGSAGTFASGRPEVNVSHFGGSAGTFSGGKPTVTITGAQGIEKNVALSNYSFVMYNSSGTPTTGLTVTCNVGKDSGAFSGSTNSVTEVANGWYRLDLTGTELNPTTVTRLRCTATGAVDYNAAFYPVVR